MRIQSLDISGFRGIRHLRLDFDRTLTVLVGENGAGKTRVLDALGLLLDQYIANVVPRTQKKALKFKSSDTNSDRPAVLKIAAETGSEDLYWTRSRGNTKDLGIEFDFAAKKGKKLSEYAQALPRNGTHQHLPLLVYYGSQRAVLGYPKDDREPADLSPQAAYAGSLTGTLDFGSLVIWFRDRSLDELQRQQEDGAYCDTALEAVRAAMKVATGLEKPVYRPVREPRGLCVEKAGKLLSVMQLSSGEQLYLALAGDLARRLSLLNPSMPNPQHGDGVVLIDDIELQLHPRWQRRILPYLLTTFPNCQFIVSTHSPQVLGTVTANQVRILHPTPDGNAEAIKPSAVHGRDSNYILLSVLGAKERDPEIQERLDRLEGAIADGELDQAETLLADLEPDMEGGPAELILARSRIERRKRSQPA